MEKEAWKDKVLRSLEGAQRAEPNPQLYQGIQARLGKLANSGKMEIVRRPYLALAAACLALLITANIYAMAQQNRPAQISEATVYQLDQTNFDLY